MMSLKMEIPLCMMFLLVISGALGNQWSVKYSKQHLCAVKGSTVVMEATYTHPTDVTVINRFWLINPVKGVEATDLRNEPGYSGRVEYLGDKQNHFSLRLSDVKKSDENMYCFKFITDKKEGYQGYPGITLNVTDLQLIAPAEVTEGESVILTCKTTCSLTDPTFIWYKNTHDLTTNTFKSNELHLQRVSSEDAGSYNCAVRGSEHLPSPAQYLSVRYLRVIAPAEVTEGESVILTCNTSFSLTDQTFIWYKNTHDLTTNTFKSNELHLQRVSSEDAGSYSCAVRGSEHLQSPAHNLSVRYPPKNVFISLSGEIVEKSSVNLTCSSDANPPVENYTWFKEEESSPVGSGQSYRALQSGLYYCEVQNKLGSERSAAVSITITGGFVIAYVAAGLGIFALVALLSAPFWLRCRRQKKKADEGDHQNIGLSAKDDTYAALDPAGRKSDDVYHTLTFSHPSPADVDTSSD